MRPIDADALIEDLRYDREHRWYGSAAYKKSYIDKSLYAEHRIEKAPTIDVAPMVHGRWIYGITLNHEWRKCSECLVSQDIFGCFTYCPNCGAKMDGEAN